MPWHHALQWNVHTFTIFDTSSSKFRNIYHPDDSFLRTQLLFIRSYTTDVQFVDLSIREFRADLNGNMRTVFKMHTSFALQAGSLLDPGAMTSHERQSNVISPPRERYHREIKSGVEWSINVMTGYDFIEAKTKWPPFRRWCFQMHFLNETIWISNDISLNCIPQGLTDTISSLIQIMA